MVSAIKAAIGDLVLTFLWVFFSSMLGLATNTITTALDLHHVSYNGFDYPSAVIITSLIFILVTIFTFVGNALGGASFNPTANASSYAAGLGSDSLFSMALRFPAQCRGFSSDCDCISCICSQYPATSRIVVTATVTEILNFGQDFVDQVELMSGGGVTQALGSVGGVLAVMEVMPPKYRHLIGGPSLKVSLHTGAIAEGVLTFVITFVVLLIMIRGPRSEAVKTWLMAISTVVLITAGSAYTGPAMNPAFHAFKLVYILSDLSCHYSTAKHPEIQSSTLI
ncbi:Aquaporin SIP1-1 [Glycine soja]|nr:Aquaporin SIP1-1 [Glycine soja]